MAITASKLRENVYRILDRVLETGDPVEIVRSGRKLKIIPVESSTVGKLDRLQPHPEALIGDPEEIVHLDWSDHWTP